jgi:hypothetical protein
LADNVFAVGPSASATEMMPSLETREQRLAGRRAAVLTGALHGQITVKHTVRLGRASAGTDIFQEVRYSFRSVSLYYMSDHFGQDVQWRLISHHLPSPQSSMNPLR